MNLDAVKVDDSGNKNREPLNLAMVKSDFAPVYCASTPSGKTQPCPRPLLDRVGRMRFLTCSNPSPITDAKIGKVFHIVFHGDVS